MQGEASAKSGCNISLNLTWPHNLLLKEHCTFRPFWTLGTLGNEDRWRGNVIFTFVLYQGFPTKCRLTVQRDWGWGVCTVYTTWSTELRGATSCWLMLLTAACLCPKTLHHCCYFCFCCCCCDWESDCESQFTTETASHHRLQLQMSGIITVFGKISHVQFT